jgi:hypothetical protein
MDLLESYLNYGNLKGLRDLLNSNEIKINGLISKYRTSPLYHFICNITKNEVFIVKNDIDIVKLLIDHGADVNYIWKKKNVLSLLCNCRDDSAETVDMIKLLLDNKIDNDNPSLRQPAITYAINTNNSNVVKLLVENKIEIKYHTISCYNRWFDEDYSIVTKILLEYTPPEILTMILSNVRSDILLTICNYGCLNIFKKIIYTPNLFSLIFGDEIDLDYEFDPVKIFMEQHDCWLVSGNIIESTLLKTVILNINEFKDYECWCRKNILGDGKDLNNYIEIAKILIILGADTYNIEIPDVLKSYVAEIKNTLCEYLLHFVPKVLVNMITDYMFNPNR